MNFFSQVDDAFVLLRSNGVFKQEPLYQRGGRLYAKSGTGFIGLLEFQRATTKPNTSWVEINIDFSIQTGVLYIA
jgi:hypothetical protein